MFLRIEISNLISLQKVAINWHRGQTWWNEVLWMFCIKQSLTWDCITHTHTHTPKLTQSDLRTNLEVVTLLFLIHLHTCQLYNIMDDVVAYIEFHKWCLSDKTLNCVAVYYFIQWYPVLPSKSVSDDPSLHPLSINIHCVSLTCHHLLHIALLYFCSNIKIVYQTKYS